MVWFKFCLFTDNSCLKEQLINLILFFTLEDLKRIGFFFGCKITSID